MESRAAYRRGSWRRVRRATMNNCGDSIRVVHPLFQAEGSGSTPTSPLQFHFGEINLDLAINLNALWHSRLPNVVKNNVQRVRNLVCFGAEFSDRFYMSAIWTDPIARLLNGRNWLELRRFAIAPDAPRNSASRMLAWMTRQIKRRGFDKAISYQDTAVHTGTIYRAAGWKDSYYRTGGTWNNPSRQRAKSQTDAPKVRWELDLTQRSDGDGGRNDT